MGGPFRTFRVSPAIRMRHMSQGLLRTQVGHLFEKIQSGPRVEPCPTSGPSGYQHIRHLARSSIADDGSNLSLDGCRGCGQLPEPTGRGR